MRKLLLTFLSCIVAVSVQAVTATVYVKAESAPYLYSWCNQGGVIELLGSWPGTRMTETVEVKGVSFWKMDIATPEEVTSFNIIFNNGFGGQTEDIIGLSSDRYYTYDGNRTYNDISEEYESVPNAEISQVEFSDKSSGTSSLMTKEDDYVYTMTIDLSNTEADLSFRLLVNGSIYGDLMSNLLIVAPDGWIEKQGEYCVLHHSTTDYKSYLFTATWEPNVNALEGWTLKVEGKDYRYEKINSTEWQMLAAYYQSAGQGSGWTNKWDFTSSIPSVKTLPGVTASDGHVVSIDLSSNGVSGMFPIALLALPQLESLNLSGNQLTGDLGMTVAAYVKMNPTAQIVLRDVNISNNQLTGNVGLFAACLPNLEALDASHNCLEDVYPMISPNVTSLNLGQQTIGRVVELNLDNLTVEAMAEKMPSILLYNHAQQTFIPEINILCTNGELADYRTNWSIILSYKNGQATIPYASSANVYYGQSGDVLNVAVVNDTGMFEGTTFRIQLGFNEGDANFDGKVSVLDVQADVRFIFNEYNKLPFNFTAANLWNDEQINVQDIVPLVNLLFETNTPATQMIRRSASTDDADAVVFCANGNLMVSTTRPVAAFDITLSGCRDINVKALRQQGFVCESRQTLDGLRLIGYSLSGSTLPVGESVIGQMDSANGSATCAQLADTDALEIMTEVGDNGHLTNINTPGATLRDAGEAYRLSLGNGHAISIDSHGKKTFINDTKTVK